MYILNVSSNPVNQQERNEPSTSVQDQVIEYEKRLNPRPVEITPRQFPSDWRSVRDRIKDIKNVLVPTRVASTPPPQIPSDWSSIQNRIDQMNDLVEKPSESKILATATEFAKIPLSKSPLWGIVKENLNQLTDGSVKTLMKSEAPAIEVAQNFFQESSLWDVVKDNLNHITRRSVETFMESEAPTIEGAKNLLEKSSLWDVVKKTIN